MTEHKHIGKIVGALMAAAVAFCLIVTLFADRFVAVSGSSAATMEYKSTLFDTSEIMTVNIIMDEDQWQELLDNAISEKYYACDVEINGETISNVGIRTKGNTSLSSIANDPDTDRYSFKIKFDKYVDGQTCMGLDKLVLNNNFADATNRKEALVYDIQKTKDFGFNMIRKHVKVEPARWYTHCDKLGIIVWQDMPNGDREPEWQMYNYFTGNELNRSEESEQIYRKEWKEIMDYLYNYPCIGVWVPFNERWGQFKTEDIATWTKKYDPSRLVNPASGGNHFPCGDILDLHHYPNPSLDFYDAGRATVLGEYGGIGLALNEHLWGPNHNWGYVKFNSPEEVTKQYVEYGNELYRLISRGFSAAVYTQTTDVEMEVNGLMTYDRKVIKVNEAQVKAINTKICNSLNK